MNSNVAVSPTKPTGWARSTSIGSSASCTSSSTTASVIPSPPSSELCALIGFAYRLGSIVHNNDLNVGGSESDVRREAKLLMSLSCSSPVQIADDERNTSGNSCNKQQLEGDPAMTTSTVLSSASPSSSSSLSSAASGRITPTHSITSISSGGSRRDSFCFTCPSLSLENKNNTRGSAGITSPGIMLSRTLKVDDKDAMRLSSEAMARNIIESFQKAIVWRIQSWVDSLSKVLVMKELELKKITSNTGNSKESQQLLQEELYFSKEALLIKTLQEIESKLKVIEATTAFKVLNKVSQVDETGSALKKRRKGEEEDRTGLGEGEYIYNVVHVLEMQCSLNISTPAGNVRVDLNVPGKINGTFFSSEDEDSEDKLTDVTIDLNTDMVASMIEKSSRIAVRASSEAMLKGDVVVPENNDKADTKTPQEETAPVTTSATTTALPTRSPKRKVEDSSVSGLVVITPARTTASSPSSFGESSDSDGDQPVVLRIPNSFPSSKMLQPKAGKSLDFAARLPPKKYMLQQKKKAAAAVLITPLKTKGPEFIEREQGPNLPILMEGASSKK